MSDTCRTEYGIGGVNPQHDKAYDPNAVMLSTLPPVYLCRWICRCCGATGTDRQEVRQDNEYEQLRRRFTKGK